MTKQYFLVLDVETANSTDDALVYDLGVAITDRKGTIYFSDSMLVSNIFYGEADLMKSAYYAKKIPQYLVDLGKGVHKVVSFYEARALICKLLREWKVEAVCAYNARFDCNALNTTQRWLTKSKYRFFLPYGTKVYDIWHMACQVICTQKRYIKFCIENNKFSEKGNMLTNAETVYAYISKEADFAEAHTGLRDTLIEAQIMAHCFRQHKVMKKNIYSCCWRIPQAKAKEARA